MVIAVAKEVHSRPVDTVPVYDAQDLTKNGDLAQIQLGDQLYTLRITRAGKLILTK
jgi:hemin uptake protein HemP